MYYFPVWFLIWLLPPFVCPIPVEASVASYAVRETTEFVLRKFGKEAAEQGAEVLGKKIALLAGKYGDEALVAFKKVGPRVTGLVDDAGQHADVAVRLLAAHGDEAARIVAGTNLTLVARLGDDAASALMRHGDAVVPLLDRFGPEAAQALGNVSSQQARRLAMLQADGLLGQRSSEVLGVVGKFGDGAVDWLWRNKGTVFLGAGLAAFLSDPEPFINGAVDISETVATSAVEPLVTAAVQSAPWVPVFLVFGPAVGVSCVVAYWHWYGWPHWTIPMRGKTPIEAANEVHPN